MILPTKVKINNSTMLVKSWKYLNSSPTLLNISCKFSWLQLVSILVIYWRYELLTYSLLRGRVFLGLSLKSPLSLWVMIEINFVSLVGLSRTKHFNKEVIIYFIVQRATSLALVIDLLTKSPLRGVLRILCLMVKLGIVPFHAWLLIVLLRLPWGVFWTVSVWQKLLPTILLSSMAQTPGHFIALRLSSILAGAFLILLSSSTRTIFAARSIYSLGWLTRAMYAQTIFLLVSWGYGLGLWRVMQKRPSLREIGVLNLSGLPPFRFFWGKLITIKEILSYSYPAAILALISATLRIYCYSRLIIDKVFQKANAGITSVGAVRPASGAPLLTVLGLLPGALVLRSIT